MSHQMTFQLSTAGGLVVMSGVMFVLARTTPYRDWRRTLAWATGIACVVWAAFIAIAPG